MNRTILILSIVLFIVSLNMETFYLAQTQKDAWSLGWGNLAFGAFSESASWFANPSLLLAWIFLRSRKKISLFFALMSLLLAFQFSVGDQLVVSSSGNTAVVSEILIGYWFWLISIATIAVGAVLGLLRTKQA